MFDEIPILNFGKFYLEVPILITMPHSEYAQCPCCGVEAEGDYNTIDGVFGWRNVNNGRRIPQSYCHDCRSARCSADEDCKK